MKYLLFLGDYFYPSGGWDDFIDHYDSLDKAIDHIKTFDASYKWAHIVYEGKIMLKFYGKEIDFTNHEWACETI